MSKTARQVVQQVIQELMTGDDIRQLASLLRESEDGMLSTGEREQIVRDLRLWEFGKWALLGDSGPGQHIRQVLQYHSRVKESPTFWQSIIPMTDDEGVAFDALMAANLSRRQTLAIRCAYQYHQSEDAGARIMGIGRYQFRVARDTGLRKLCEAAQTG